VYGAVGCFVYTGRRSESIIVGLTNVDPRSSEHNLTLWNYTVCAQYPGAVPRDRAVSLYCPRDIPPFRYVIVQLPTQNFFNFREVEVFTIGL